MAKRDKKHARVGRKSAKAGEDTKKKSKVAKRAVNKSNPPRAARGASVTDLRAPADDDQISAVERAVDDSLRDGGHDPARDRTLRDFGYNSQSILGFLEAVKQNLRPTYVLKRAINREFGNEVLPLKRGAASAQINAYTVPA